MLKSPIDRAPFGACTVLTLALAACASGPQQLPPPESASTAQAAGANAVAAPQAETAQPPTKQNETPADAAAASALTPKDIEALLAPFEGRWNTRITWSAPNFPKPLEWSGKSTLHVLGGRWLVTHHEGSFMGMGFEAQDVTGFDARTQKWTSVWADKVNDSMLFFEATSLTTGPTVLVAQTLDDKGARSWLRRSTTWKDDNTFVSSFIAPDEKGNEQEVMTITATRATAEAGTRTP